MSSGWTNKVRVFFLISALFWVGLAHSRPSLDCSKYFKKFLATFSEEKETKEQGLPDNVQLSIYRKEAESYFLISHSLWKERAPSKKTVEILERFIESGEKLGEDEIKELKISRQLSAILRASFNLFDSDHEAPKEFRKYVSEFGKLNDAIEAKAWKRARAFSPEVIKLSKKVDKLDLEKEFEAAPRSSTQSNLATILDKIKDHSSEKNISMKNYHDLRKKLKIFLNAFRYKNLVEKDTDAKETFLFLAEINNKLGEEHDRVIRESLKGESSYEDTEMKLNKYLRHQIRDFFRKIVLD